MGKEHFIFIPLRYLTEQLKNYNHFPCATFLVTNMLECWIYMCSYTWIIARQTHIFFFLSSHVVLFFVTIKWITNKALSQFVAQQGGGQIQPLGPIQPIQPIQPNVQPVPGGMFPPNQVAQGPRDAWVYASCSFNQSNPNVMNNPAFRGRIDMRQQVQYITNTT